MSLAEVNRLAHTFYMNGGNTQTVSTIDRSMMDQNGESMAENSGTKDSLPLYKGYFEKKQPPKQGGSTNVKSRVQASLKNQGLGTGAAILIQE